MGLLDDFSTLSDSAKQYALNKLAQFGNGVGNTVQQIPGNAQRLAQGLLNLPQQASNEVGQLFRPQTNTKLAGLLAHPQQANPGQWMDQGMALAGMAPVMGLLGHTVYHGSPHKFDAFDMSKIGTGEGAQAYGHGLYFAEAPSVAEDYARMNLNGPANVAYRAGKDGGDSLAALKRTYPGMPNAWYDSAIRKATEEGNLYKVDIPDEAIPKMLDWDVPLSQQTDALNQLGITDAGLKQIKLIGGDGDSVSSLLKAMGATTSKSGALDHSAASSLLLKRGITGIRYLDGNSRDLGQGTRNLVLFDDKLPRILEVNGKPIGDK